jgi:signal transduction histidine kinase
MTTRHLSIRARLTLLYGALVLLAGAALLTIVLVILDHVIDTQPIVLDDRYVAQLTGATPTNGAVAPDQQKQAKATVAETAEAIRTDLRHRTLTPLLGPSLVALGVFGAGGFVAVWFVAGRALRPVRTITATAQNVAAGRLDTRIELQGPRDELRGLADAFDAMLDRLHRVFASQRDFIGNASHELRTPIAISRTLLDVAMTDPDAPPELTRVGSQLIEVNARQDRLVEGLLTLARSGNVVTEPCSVDLDGIVRDVIQRHGGEAADRGVTIDLCTSRTPSVQGDPVLLERLVENVVQNAVRHNVPGGTVTVEVRDRSPEVLVTVGNTGPALSVEDPATLFEPFRRATDRVDGRQGCGLGLSIVKMVAEAHRGSASLTANPGGGLTVEIRLPKAT